MIKFLLSAILACLALSAQGANVLFSFGNPTNSLPYLSEVVLTPTNLPTVINGVIVINDSLKLKADASGQCVFSNLYPLTYNVLFTLAGKNIKTPFQITLTNSLSDTSTVAAVLTAPIHSSPAGTTAYSMVESVGLFAPKVSPSLSGTISLLGSSTVGYVWTATNILGAGGWSAATGGGITNNQSGVTLAGAFSGNGSGLTNLPADSSKLSTNLATLKANNGSDFASPSATLANLGGVATTTNLLAGHTFTFDPTTLFITGFDVGAYYAVTLVPGRGYYFDGGSQLDFLMNGDANTVSNYNRNTGGFDQIVTGFFVAATNQAIVASTVNTNNGAAITNDFLFAAGSSNYNVGTAYGVYHGDGSTLIAELPDKHASLAVLVAQTDNTSGRALDITNGMVSFGSDHMGINDVAGTPQYSFSANSHASYRGTNVVATSKENIIEIINYDRTEGGYIAFQSGITNAGSAVSTLSPAQDVQIGFSGDLYNRRLSSPSPNFNRVLFIALNSPADFCLSSTDKVGTNSLVAFWYFDNTNAITYFAKNTGGSTPRDPNYKPALVINHITGAVTVTNGLLTASNFTATGTITGLGSGLTNANGTSYGTGSVSSVGLTMPGVIFNASVTGSPITGSGTLTPTLATQASNTFLAGPVSGSVATPTFRTLGSNDLFGVSGFLLSLINATNITGTIQTAQFPAVLPAASGANLTSIPESAVTSLVSDLAAKAPIASPTFTGTATAGTFAGSGASLTLLPAAQLTGTQANGTESTNTPLKNAANTFTGANQITNGAGSGIVFEKTTNAWAVYSNGVSVAWCDTNGNMGVAGNITLSGGGSALRVAGNVAFVAVAGHANGLSYNTPVGVPALQVASATSGGTVNEVTLRGDDQLLFGGGDTYVKRVSAGIVGVPSLAVTNSITTPTITITNAPTFLSTNAAPTGVTIGTTVPDAWQVISNSAGRFFMPVWTNH